MTNDDNIKTVHELYGCASKNKMKQRLKFAKYLFAGTTKGILPCISTSS